MTSYDSKWEDNFSTIYDDTMNSKTTITFDIPPPPPPESRPPTKQVEIRIVDKEPDENKQSMSQTTAGGRRKSVTIRRKSIAKNKPSKMHSRIFLVYKSIIFLVLLVGLLGLMIAMIVMGGRYEDKCPFNKFIPLWLILFGTVGLVFVVFKICSAIFARFIHEESHHVPQILTVIGFLTSLLGFILLVLLVVGSVWVYKKEDMSFDPKDDELYCHKTCYYFAFWTLTSIYIIIGLLCIVGCLIVIIVGIMDEAAEKKAAAEAASR